jgi:hypothetical protein
MATDLFGRPIFDSPRARQPELFDDRHWFWEGYEDGRIGHDYVEELVAGAYLLGYSAAVRDRRDGRGLDVDRAWAEAKAVGNVED